MLTPACASRSLQGLAIALVLVPRGISPFASALWAIFSSLPQPLTAVPAFAFVHVFVELLPLGLGFASGAMAAMVFSELIPDARAGASDAAVVSVMALSALVPLLIAQVTIVE